MRGGVAAQRGLYAGEEESVVITADSCMSYSEPTSPWMPRQTSEPTANRRNGRLSVFRLGDTHTQVLVYTSFLCGFYDIGFSLTESISHCILTILFAFITILTVQSGNLRMLFCWGKNTSQVYFPIGGHHCAPPLFLSCSPNRKDQQYF